MSTDDAASVSGAKRRLLERLKRVDSATATELAADFGLTATAVRQHLEDLARTGLVEAAAATPSGRGRPAQLWKLTPLAASLFPDRHADLTVSLLESIRETLGEPGIDAVVAARTKAQMAAYKAVLPDPASSPLVDRVEALARVRSVEGYMAESAPAAGQGADAESFVLVEHHCPICEAAESCQSLCRGELELFRTVLGDDVTVERTQHLLSGDLRCAYRITRTRQPSRRHPLEVVVEPEIEPAGPTLVTSAPTRRTSGRNSTATASRTRWEVREAVSRPGGQTSSSGEAKATRNASRPAPTVVR